MSNKKQSYLDIQVNGYACVDFNQNKITCENMEFACNKLVEDDVDGIFATIITTDLKDMVIRIKQLIQLRNQSSLIRGIIKGIHIEGPFINASPGYHGAHPIDAILKPDVEIMKELLNAGDGLVRIVTLAPEKDDQNKVTRFLASQNITVSAGHCNPSMGELESAIDAGLNMFTHLGNGCPQDLPRHDNIIQRVLSFKDNLQLCFIADGIHIPFYALKNYISIAGIENIIITTDSMAAAGAKEGRYTLSNIKLEVGKDRVVREQGKNNFAGSAIDMKSSYSNLIKHLGLSVEDAKQMTYFNPLKIFNTKKDKLWR